MARAVPETIHGGASRGEHRLFGTLCRLPDDVLVCFEPRVGNRHPDFVVVLPTVGILVIEVKGWFPAHLSRADQQTVRYRRDGIEQEERHPLRQARDYMFRVQDAIRGDAAARGLLLQAEGERVGRVRFPVACAAILSNANRQHLNDHVPGAEASFPPSQVVCRDEFLKWDEVDPDSLLRILRSFFDPWWAFPPMPPEAVDAIARIITGSRLPGPVPVDPPPRPDEAELPVDPPELKYLDADQEEEARRIGAGHRIVYGVPGSGKTVMLLARARFHRERYPEHRVLVTCFNVCLAAYLERRLDGTGAEVKHFHRLMQSRIPFDRNVPAEEHGNRILATLGPAHRVYDAVFVDEAQDFVPSWFRCLLALMKDPENGDLLIVGDGGQGIANQGHPVVWNALGIRARGRTRRLRTNYRNTREIVSVAEQFAVDDDAAADDDAIGSVRIDPEQTVRRGGRVYVLRCDGRRNEILAAEHLVRDLLEGRWGDVALSRPYAGAEIGILYPRANEPERPLLAELETALAALPGSGGAVWIQTNHPTRGDTRRMVAGPGVKILTVDSSRGLQFRAVIVLFADQFDAHEAGADRSRAYVALTRSEDQLAVLCSQVTEPVRRIWAQAMPMG